MQVSFDDYTIRARVAPAVLAVSPLLATGITLVPELPGAQKLWSLVGFGVIPFVALTARYAGNRVQPILWNAWGGAPASVRLRFRGATNSSEVRRRHADVEKALDRALVLPTEADETANPAAADVEYDAAIRRLIGRVRSTPGTELLRIENRNYGFARNLYGLRRAGIWCAGTALVGSAAVGAFLVAARGLAGGYPFLSTGVALLGLIGWKIVTPAWVRPSAEAYADRLMEAAQAVSMAKT
jgi:hypothetical protein